MRNLPFALLLCFSSSFMIAQQSGIAIQLAAFDRYVSNDYFSGIDGVYHTVDHNDIYRYYLGGFDSKEAAKSKVDEMKNRGYNLQIVDLTALREQCSNSCGIVDPTTIRSIFFDFDKANLRNTSVSELDKLYQVLVQNPGYSTELSAHTDAHGSDDYNKSLSQRRAQSAREYLISKGIASARVKTSTFGENQPIAKNVLNGGKDTPTGRQYNRRVELKIYDGKKQSISRMVEAINVPQHLQKS